MESDGGVKDTERNRECAVSETRRQWVKDLGPPSQGCCMDGRDASARIPLRGVPCPHWRALLGSAGKVLLEEGLERHNSFVEALRPTLGKMTAGSE